MMAEVMDDVERKDRMIDAANRMMEYGGGFASSIGAAWFRADSGNRAKLEGAFPELFERYMGGA
jgi:hypothetical protein